MSRLARERTYIADLEAQGAEYDGNEHYSRKRWPVTASIVDQLLDAESRVIDLYWGKPMPEASRELFKARRRQLADLALKIENDMLAHREVDVDVLTYGQLLADVILGGY